MTREEIETKNNVFWQERVAEQRETIEELAERLENGRNYLMQVEKITIAETLTAFGFREDEL